MINSKLKTWKIIRDENKRNFYMNFRLKGGFGVQFTAYKTNYKITYKSQMM